MKYRYIREWVKAENIPTPINEISDPVLRDKYMAQFVELRDRLFAQHLESLSSEEQLQYRNDTHPSLHRGFEDRAKPYAQEFDAFLRALGFAVKNVEIAYWHGDQLVLTARLSEPPTEEQLDHFPDWFHTFRARYIVEF